MDPNNRHSHFHNGSSKSSGSRSGNKNSRSNRRVTTDYPQAHLSSSSHYSTRKHSVSPKRPYSSLDDPIPKNTMKLSLTIPRKASAIARGANLASNNNRRVSIKSEFPFILKIKTKGMAVNYRSSISSPSSSTAMKPGLRSSGRSRKRKSYIDDLVNDSDFMDTDDELDLGSGVKPPKVRKKSRLQKMSTSGSNAALTTFNTATSLKKENHLEQNFSLTGSTATDYDPNQIEAPPQGVISSLWYSRECVLHVWAIERIIGWKARHVVTLESYLENKVETPENVPLLDVPQALVINDKLITKNITNRWKRMDISRINPSQCPLVIATHALKEEKRSKKAGTNSKFGIKNVDETEEVLLIKWRGRSHMHCSWERPKDLEYFDTSNNTARGKIKRYYQAQHTLFGKEWKKVVEEGRKVSGNSLHGHGAVGIKMDCNDGDIDKDGDFEEFFQPDHLEIERILACDENEMNMNVLSKQRASNLKAEKDAAQRRQKKSLPNSVKADVISKDAKSDGEEEDQWDPEDNVRYVVKWKGLQYSDITWEYWRHIKHDGVNQAEDFWHRQKAPNPDELKAASSKGHPHMREYKKLLASPEFGITTMKRPIADLGHEEVKPLNNVEEDESTSGLRLRSYQLEGVNWLLWNWWNKRSCILADEMGLGKTIQSMCFLSQLFELKSTNIPGPFLVVAPLSLVNQWQSESELWAPDMNVLLYHGSMDARDFLVKQEFYYSDQFVSKTTALKLKRQHATKFHILITTYEVAMKDVTVLSKIKWKALIVDEAHRLKNSQSRLFSELAAVPRDFCLLLTGTPLQNSTDELWSLLNFSDPIAFASREEFVRKFGQLSDSKQVSELHTVLRPYLLRRVKEDVEKSLPPKTETILEVTLTPIQKTYYKAIYEKNTSFLFKGSKPSNAPSLMNIMMELRKCCNHPFLIKGAEERIMVEAAAKQDQDESDDPIIRWQQLLGDQLVQSSGKMVLLMKLLPKLQSGGHKVLIFSQMVRVLDLLEELLRFKKYAYERLDGSTGATARATAVDRFNKKSYQRFVMLLSTRAGGLGLNLTSADTVVIFDSDWNPQNDLQAMARAHRIGQTRAVRVYRLLTAKTYEMHMFHSASMKLGLDRAVLAHQRQQGGEDQDTSKKGKSKSEKELQAKEIDELLKKGAYDVFRDDDDSEAQKFMETDIDQLLERSSRTVTYGNTDNSISNGLGSFSKASFVTSDADGKDIDLDDPDFWEKAVGLDTPADVSSESLLYSEKRMRKQVQVFDPFANFYEAEQKKKDKIALKAKQEKEEKKKRKLEKKKKNEEQKAIKKKVRNDKPKHSEEEQTNSLINNDHVTKEKKLCRENKTRRMKKAEQRRAFRLMEQEDPVLDRIKQGWETNQRDRAINGILLFGFGRFCKIRNESNLISLPIQDIEVFLRACMYQLGLQASISIMSSIDAEVGDVMKQINIFHDSVDGDWVLNAILSSMKFHELLLKQERDLRMPQILNEPTFVKKLQSGRALLSLRSLAFLSRLNIVVECALNQALKDLGQEELGKRGCPTKDLSTLDIDLKARHVTTEELSYAIGRRLEGSWINKQLSASTPAPWWDRSCDLGLIIGTFTYGLHCYRAMQNDDNLPFKKKTYGAVKDDFNCTNAYENFLCSANAARNTFEKALRLSQARHAVDEELINNSVTAEQTDKSKGADSLGKTSNDNLTGEDLKKSTEKETVTLLCLSSSINQGLKNRISTLQNGSVNANLQKLPMPDSKCLDHRILELVNLIDNKCHEKRYNGHIKTPDDSSRRKNGTLRKRLSQFLGVSEHRRLSLHGPFDSGASTICRSILDGTSSYLLGAASEKLASISTSHESLKYQRGPGVPSVLTRYGLVALLYADTFTLKKVLDVEEKIIRKESRLKGAPQEKVDKGKPDQKVQSELFAYELNNVPIILTNNADQRSALCAALLCCGYCLPSEAPLPNKPSQTLKELCHFHSYKFFRMSNLLEIASQISGSVVSFSEEGAVQYIKNVLIPHCTRACLLSSDSLNDTKATTCTKIGFKNFRDTTGLPDPFIPLCEHSAEAVGNASALLRRMKLATTIRFLTGQCGGIELSDLLNFLKSREIRNYTNGVPLWWCPWIHDIALLVYASMFGLLSIVYHRREKSVGAGDGGKTTNYGVLDTSEIELHVRRLFLQGGSIADTNHSFENEKPLLSNRLLKKTNPLDLQRLLVGLTRQFPSSLVIERRLGFICDGLSRICVEKQGHDGDGRNTTAASWMFADFPMFDHGGWPKNA